jgi:hypothetical protein
VIGVCLQIGNRKRDDADVTAPPAAVPSSPANNAESVPLLDNAVPGLGATAANGALAPVTGLVGSAPGVVKGALGSATGTLNGLLGGTPVGGIVGGVGNIGTGLAGGLLDQVGGVAGGELGLGQILKPVTGTVGGLLNGLPIVGPIAGPIAGGLTGTLSGLNLAQPNTLNGQVNPLNVAPDPSMIQYPGPGMGAPASGFVAQAQAVQEKVVGDLGGGSFLTNTGRIVSLLPGGGTAIPAAPGLPVQAPSAANGALGGLPQLPSGLTNLDGLGSVLRPIASNPLSGQGQVPFNLGNIVSNLPPGLSQIIQPVGSAEKFLQIGNQLIPLGAMDPTRLAQLGLDKLPVSAVNGIPGVPSINYLQDTDGGDEESKEVKANPVTSWMNEGDAPSNSTIPANETHVDPNVPTPNSGAGNGPEAGSDAPQMAQLNVQPLYVAPTNTAGRPAPKGSTQWSEIDLYEGETFSRIADSMSGREHNYYSGSEHNSTIIDVPTNGTISDGNSTIIEPAPDFHAKKGRVGWQLVSEAEPSTTSGWHSVGPSATATASSSGSAVRTGPTAAPSSDAGTYAWNEDWGDWVSAGMDDMGLNVDWDEMAPYEDPTPGASGSQMYPQPSAGLS